MLTDDKLTYEAIAGFRWVYNEFGYGLIESAYVGALTHAWTKKGLYVEKELAVPVYFDGTIVANYRMDLVLERRLIVEIKACRVLLPEHIKQVFHYVRVTDLELALLLNFGVNPEIKRFTIRNEVKRYRQPR